MSSNKTRGKKNKDNLATNTSTNLISPKVSPKIAPTISPILSPDGGIEKHMNSQPKKNTRKTQTLIPPKNEKSGAGGSSKEKKINKNKLNKIDDDELIEIAKDSSDNDNHDSIDSEIEKNSLPKTESIEGKKIKKHIKQNKTKTQPKSQSKTQPKSQSKTQPKSQSKTQPKTTQSPSKNLSKVKVKPKIKEADYAILENYDPEEERRKDSEEELLNEEYYRLATKPINPTFKIIWDLYKKQQESSWTAEEIDFSTDRHDFAKLDENKQHFIKMILAFFAGADSIVNLNIRKKFADIKVKEAEVAYGFQTMMENVHGEVYADMLINIIEDEKERSELINGFKKVKSIKLMIEWGKKWIDSDRRLAFSIVAFTIFEGLMFSGAFAAIYWLKRIIGEDKMKGLVQSNNFIAKDEGMHTNFGCVMYDYIKHRLTENEINALMIDAVNIAKGFTQDAIRADMIGMNLNLMSLYLEYVADRLMVYLGYKKIYETNIPDSFQFMESIGFLNKDNFFERRGTEYMKACHDDNRADWQFKILDVY